MENLYNRIRQSKIGKKLPTKGQINSALAAFSKKERIVFSVLVLVLLLSTVSILESINRHFMVSVPAYGGEISEGIVGTPRFINPVLANSPADLDLVSLVYSGLLRRAPDGSLIPDLAEKYDISKDGLTYTFTLKDNIYFQDGKPVTADDVIFTVNKIKDSVIKSPHKANWDGVTAQKNDEKTVVFTLKQPYASFLENITLGIMPSYLWSNSPIELNGANTAPVGSGPYMISSLSKQGSGIIDYYQLSAFKKFALGRPYINTINLYFYGNEDDLVQALQSGQVDQISSITPAAAETLKASGYRIESAVLPRVFGLFFNQNVNRLFVDKAVTSAINQAIDKDRIVREVLGGYGVVIDSPIPPNMLQYSNASNPGNLPSDERLQKAASILAADGWQSGNDGFLEKTTPGKKAAKGKLASGGKTTALEFSISTGNSPELAKTALFIKEDLEKIGIKVDIKTFEVNNLNQDVIRPRKYDALLFGEIINTESDLFAFWHSSQRLDPGLNVAMYTNAKVDKILEDAFVTINKDTRVKKYMQFEDEIKKDMPAVFLYSPNFIYIVSDKIQGLTLGNVTSPSNRFLDVYSWYTEKDNVWKIFTK